MLRFPNPGSTIANFIEVYSAAFRALHGRVVNLDHIVRAVVDAGLATSSGYVGDEAVVRSTRADRSRDPLYNQMKMYAELFRSLGWLHPTETSSLNYTFTLLGQELVAAGPDYWPLLKLCVLGIAYPTRILTVAGDAQIRPFSFILKVMKHSGGYLTRDEMIIGPLSTENDRDVQALPVVSARIKAARNNAAAMRLALESLSTRKKIQINTLQNYTRWPIAILRDSGWVDEVQVAYRDGTKRKAFALSTAGQNAAEMLETAHDLRLSDVESLKPDVRDAVAVVSHFRMLGAAGFDIAPVQGRIDAATRIAVRSIPDIDNSSRAILFSPFQALSLKDIHRVFPGGSVSSVHHESTYSGVVSVKGRDDRSHLFVIPKLITGSGCTTTEADAVKDELHSLIRHERNLKHVATSFCRRHSDDTREEFYPLVTHLFQILGFRSSHSRAGANYQRWDACVWIGNHALPVEIKSPTEEEFLGTKAIRQALENKVVLLARGGLSTTLELSSLIVGFQIPNERGEMSNLIDNVYSAFGLRLGVIDLGSLAYLAAKAVDEGVTIDADQLAHLRGFLDVGFCPS